MVNYMTPTPKGGNFGIKSVKLMFIVKKIFSTPGHGYDKLSIKE